MKKYFPLIHGLKHYSIPLVCLLALLFLALIAWNGLAALNSRETSLIPAARQIEVNAEQYQNVLQQQQERTAKSPQIIKNPLRHTE